MFSSPITLKINLFIPLKVKEESVKRLSHSRHTVNIYFYYSLFVIAQPSVVFSVHWASKVTSTQQLVSLIRAIVCSKYSCLEGRGLERNTEKCSFLRGSLLHTVTCLAPRCLPGMYELLGRKGIWCPPQHGTGETRSHDCGSPSSPLSSSTSRELSIYELTVCYLRPKDPSSGCSLFHFGSCPQLCN